VTLRPFRPEELDAFAQSRPAAPRERLAQRIACSGELVDGLLDLAIEAEGRLVGDIGARNPPEGSPPGVFDVGIELFRRRDRGRGLGRQALGLLTAHLFDSGLAERVQGSTAVSNVAMRRVFEHLGFAEEGMMRAFMPTSAGARETYVLYGVTRAEWTMHGNDPG
jgi:RimJ/RimL family protein N-acetyltransferase